MAVGKEGNVKWVDVSFLTAKLTRTSPPTPILTFLTSGPPWHRLNTGRHQAHHLCLFPIPAMARPKRGGGPRPVRTALPPRPNPGPYRRSNLLLCHGLRLLSQACQELQSRQPELLLQLYQQISPPPCTSSGIARPHHPHRELLRHPTRRFRDRKALRRCRYSRDYPQQARQLDRGRRCSPHRHGQGVVSRPERVRS